MITRTIVFRYRICCYDVRFTELSDCERYQECSEWEEEPIRERQDDFDDSLVRWADNIERELRERIVEEGDSECAGISEYHEFCSYELEVIEAANEEEECPDWVRRLAEHHRDEIAYEEGFIVDMQAIQARATVDEFIQYKGGDKEAGEKQYNWFIAISDEVISSHQALVESERQALSELLADYPECR